MQVNKDGECARYEDKAFSIINKLDITLAARRCIGLISLIGVGLQQGMRNK